VELNLLKQERAFDVRMGDYHMRVDLDEPDGSGAGPSPLKMMMASLAGCTAFDVIAILRKSRQNVEGMVIKVTGDRVATHPRRYERLKLSFEVWGKGLDPTIVQRAVSLSQERYCSVAATLREPTEVIAEVWVGEAPPPEQ
jgi:putative redox protein